MNHKIILYPFLSIFFVLNVHADLITQFKNKIKKEIRCESVFEDPNTNSFLFFKSKKLKPKDIEIVDDLKINKNDSDAATFAPPLPINFALPKTREEWLVHPFPLRSKIMSFLKGENLQAALHPDFYTAKVKYLDDQERQAYRIFVIDNRLVDYRGEPICEEKCRGIFVMTPMGEIYFSDKPIFREFHHSSFIAGNDVAAAGELRIKDGKLLSVNNRSGHYRPTYAHILQFLLELQTQGLHTNYKLEFYDLTGKYVYEYREEKIDKPLRKASLKKVARRPDWARRHIGPVPWELLTSEEGDLDE